MFFQAQKKKTFFDMLGYFFVFQRLFVYLIELAPRLLWE